MSLVAADESLRVSAHRNEDGKIQVEAWLHSGDPAVQALVRVTDSTGVIVFTGELDQTGQIKFSDPGTGAINIDIRLDEKQMGSYILN